MESEQNIGVKTNRIFNDLLYNNTSINPKGEATLHGNALEDRWYSPYKIAMRKAATYFVGTRDENKAKLDPDEWLGLFFGEMIAIPFINLTPLGFVGALTTISIEGLPRLGYYSYDIIKYLKSEFRGDVRAPTILGMMSEL